MDNTVRDLCLGILIGLLILTFGYAKLTHKEVKNLRKEVVELKTGMDEMPMVKIECLTPDDLETFK